MQVEKKPVNIYAVQCAVVRQKGCTMIEKCNKFTCCKLCKNLKPLFFKTCAQSSYMKLYHMLGLESYLMLFFLTQFNGISQSAWAVITLTLSQEKNWSHTHSFIYIAASYDNCFFLRKPSSFTTSVKLFGFWFKQRDMDKCVLHYRFLLSNNSY